MGFQKLTKMIANLNQKPHRRYNILTGEWVLVSPHRTKRPWQGKKESSKALKKETYNPNCYLCPGNKRADGSINPKYQSTYSFTNDFSALLQNIEPEEFNTNLLRAKTESGICKVICFSPDHSLTLPLMSETAIESIIELWQSEYQTLGSIDNINHVQIFENKGDIMGCSNPHPHGQIWAQETIPTEAAKKHEQQKVYFEKHQQGLIANYIRQELELDERIIVQNEHFVALVPFWAVWPFEAIIFPKKQHPSILNLNSEEKLDFARIIKNLTIRYDNLFLTSFPYSSGIHQAPTDNKPNEHWHFHMSFYPPLLRSADVKKFMVGYEMFANPQRDITAEYAAETLKNLSGTVHYSQP